MRKILLSATAVLAITLAGASQPARAASEEASLIDRARLTVDNLRTDAEFGNARHLLARARGVLIFPSLIKGGFFAGGEGGSGVLLVRTGSGWSDPAFYTMGSASFGLQIGIEQAEVVVLALTQRGLDALRRDEFKIGVNAGVAVVTLGSGAEADTTAAAGADIVVWASATGAYAGISINGSVIKPRPEWNAAYYGRPETVAAILSQRPATRPEADELRRDLTRVN
jgi:lipid-binding SYLF domain-containing protein